METFTINGLRFVARKQDAEKVQAHGYYRRNRGGVLLMDMAKDPQAFVVNNTHGEQFLVTAHRTGQGTRYLFGMANDTKRWLGMDGYTYGQEREVVRIALSLCPKHNQPESDQGAAGSACQGCVDDELGALALERR